jgi:hypothetical protein
MNENDVDIALCIAMFRCFNEQLYALKGVHDVEVDILYDKMMDIMVEIKLQILKENE